MKHTLHSALTKLKETGADGAKVVDTGKGYLAVVAVETKDGETWKPYKRIKPIRVPTKDYNGPVKEYWGLNDSQVSWDKHFTEK